jgi:hypothetical protein
MQKNITVTTVHTNAINDSVKVVIENGRLSEHGVTAGSVNTVHNILYLQDMFGNKVAVNAADALVQIFELLTSEQITAISSKLNSQK